MASRQELQIMLEKVFESTNVYYQPPQNVQISYPAIKYSKKKPDTKHANDKKYLKTNCYEIMVISKLPDHPVIEKLMEWDMCSYDRHYVADGLNHDILTIYI